MKLSYKLLFPLGIVLALGGCASTKLPLIPLSVPLPRIPFLSGDELDLARRDYDDALRRLVNHLREEFPLTERKGIDWAVLESDTLAKLGEEPSEGDFYYAMRNFAVALRDANVSLSESPKYLSERFEGGFGLSLTQTDDGRVFVSGLVDDGPADTAGILPMAEVFTWNDLPIKEAIATAPILWGGQPPATAARAFARQMAGITRGAIGDRARLTYRNPGADEVTANLDAVREPWGPLQSENLLPSVNLDMKTILASETLEGGVGYIRIDIFAPNMTTPFPGRAFRSALTKFIDAGAPGLIVDLRGTSAGLDEFAAEFAGHFLNASQLYRDIARFDENSEEFTIDPALSLESNFTEPKAPASSIILVDGQTARAAETFAWTLQQAGVARVAGECNTRGATTVPDRKASLPGGFTFTYPIGRWLAPDGTTPVEPDASGNGGITPDLKIPVTPETLERSILQMKDTALEWVLAQFPHAESPAVAAEPAP